jgi:hypothetical protein
VLASGTKKSMFIFLETSHIILTRGISTDIQQLVTLE